MFLEIFERDFDEILDTPAFSWFLRLLATTDDFTGLLAGAASPPSLRVGKFLDVCTNKKRINHTVYIASV